MEKTKLEHLEKEAATLRDRALHATTPQEFEQYEKLLFDGMLVFADKESNAFYPTYAYALMTDSLRGSHPFSLNFDYPKFFAMLFASNNKCNIGETVYLYRYLSTNGSLFSGKLSAKEQSAFEMRKQQFFDAIDKTTLLCKCNELELVGKACTKDDYQFLKSTIDDQPEK